MAVCLKKKYNVSFSILVSKVSNAYYDENILPHALLVLCNINFSLINAIRPCTNFLISSRKASIARFPLGLGAVDGGDED